MRNTLTALTLAVALVGLFFVALLELPPEWLPGTASQERNSPGQGADSVSLLSRNPGLADTSPTADVASLSADGNLTMRIAAAERAYLDIVYAEGMASAVKAQKRLDTFNRMVEELSKLGPDAIPLLLEQLKAASDTHSRLLLLSAIARIEGMAGVDGVLEALEAVNDPTLSQVFLDRLTRSLHPQDVLVMEEILRRGDNPADRMAIIANASTRRLESFAEYLPEIAWDDPDPQVRQQALSSAERLGFTFDADLLVDLARVDPDPNVQSEALRLFAESNPETLVPLARDLAASPLSPELESALIDALKHSEDTEAAAVLEELASAAGSDSAREKAIIEARARAVQEAREERREERKSEKKPVEKSD